MIKYIGENLIAKKNAGSKARQDVERILAGVYSKFFDMKEIPSNSSFMRKLILVFSPKSLFSFLSIQRASKKDYYFLQYPFYYIGTYNRLLTSFISKNNCILFVHDIDALRFSGKQSINEEIALLNQSRCVILHNNRMKQILVRYGLTVPTITLEVFDYLLKNDLPKIDYVLSNEIVFAGNLEKSQFLRKIPNMKSSLSFRLYGNGLPESLKNIPNIHWMGSFLPEEIPYRLKGSFGLVWDGTSLNTCDGKIGEYLKINNPHKLSLYIAAGLPVIVWSQAAIAELVQKYQIGFTINGLEEIPDKITNINQEIYEKYKNNIKKLQKKVTSGYFTKKSLSTMETILKAK